MPSILAPIIGGLRRWVSPGGAPSSPPGPTRRNARRLAVAIDRAAAQGRFRDADRLAAHAAHLAPGHARLSESMARLRLAQGDPETALAIIDAARTTPAGLRMLRASCLLVAGARHEAHSVLHRWSAGASAPPEARLLLGLLEWQGGDHAAAARTLKRNLKHLEDRRTLEALVLISLHRGQTKAAEVWARRLRAAAGTGSDGPEVELLLRSLGMDGLGREATPSAEEVSALAMELITFETAIRPLVEAQRRRPHLPTARLLCAAIEQALGDLHDTAAAFEGLARLWVILGDVTSAAAWANRGLARHPMSAPLSLLHQELEERTLTPPERRKAA